MNSFIPARNLKNSTSKLKLFVIKVAWMILKSFYVASIFLKLKVFIKSILAKYQIVIVITSVKLFKFSIVTSQLKLAILKCIWA